MTESNGMPGDAVGPRGAGAGRDDVEPLVWERVHPLTPLARFWIALLVLVFVVGRNVVESVFENGFDAGELGHGIPEFVRNLELVGWLIVVGVVLLVLGGMFWSWWFTRYAVTADTVRVREGALFRKEKQARLDRVQAIEISQPLLARILGLAELRFEVADAGESTLHLRFLTRRGAEDLRGRLLSRKRQLQDDAAAPPAAAGDAAAPPDVARAPHGPSSASPASREPGDGAPESADESAAGPEESELVRIGAGRAVVAILAGGYGIFLVLALVAVLVLNVVSLPGVSLAVLAPALFGLVTGGWGRLSSTANFRLGLTAEGLKVRYGLTSTRTQTIPLGRIQAVGIEQPLLWRPFGWFKLVINSAGIGASGADSTRNVLLPVGTGQELMRVLPYVVERPERGGVDGHQLRSALEGSGADDGFTVSPRSARWVDPLTYRRNGYATTPDLLLVRGGRLRRRLAVVPHAKVQSLRLTAGPLDRRLDLADVQLHSVGGPVTGLVRHLRTAEALELARAQARRASRARRVGQDAADAGRGAPDVGQDAADAGRGTGRPEQAAGPVGRDAGPVTEPEGAEHE